MLLVLAYLLLSSWGDMKYVITDLLSRSLLLLLHNAHYLFVERLLSRMTLDQWMKRAERK